MRGRPVSLHTKNAMVLALFLGAVAPFGWTALISVAIGGGMQLVNLRGLERSVGGMLRTSGVGGLLRGLLALRLLLLLGLVGMVLLTLPVQPLAFALGLSIVVPAVLWHGLTSAAREA